MKTKLKIYVLLGVILPLFIGCNSELDDLKPHDVLTTEALTSTVKGLQQLTTTSYSMMYLPLSVGDIGKTGLTDVVFNIGETKGNTVTFPQEFDVVDGSVANTQDAFYYVNSATNTDGLSNSAWELSYELIVNTNTVLEAIEKRSDVATNATVKELKGTNLFLRAWSYFNLVRIFGRPYWDNPDTNLGVPLKLTNNPNDMPQRATVKECYDQIIADFKAAAELLPETAAPNRTLANRYAALGLLSRVYLYMGGSFSAPNAASNQLAVDAATSVINWAGASPLPDLDEATFNQEPTANKEFLWAYAMTNIANSSWSNVGFNFYPYFGMGGEIGLSDEFLANIDQENDKRFLLYVGENENGITTTLKYSGEWGLKKSGWGFYTINPEPLIRVGEVYLNRAEAYVKLGKNTEALADLNAIRVRSGLTALTGISGQALFNAIFEERARELVCEGQNGFDFFRNNLTMTRKYASYLPGNDITSISPTDNRVIMPIPIREVNLAQLKQNPGY